MLSNPIALFLLNFFGHKTQNWFHEFFCTYIFQNRLSATGVLSRSSSKNSAIRTVFYFSSYEEAAALLRHLTDDRLRGVLRWTAACCCKPRAVCGFKNSFYSVELRTACHKDSPLFSFCISEFLTRLFSKQQHIMNSSLSSLVLQFWNVKKSGELSPTMNQPKYLWVVMACMCFCTGLTWAAPKKNNKKSSDHNSDLIPIPDDLLENYNMPSGKPKFQSKSFFREFNFTKFFVKSKLHIYRDIERLKSRFRLF